MWKNIALLAYTILLCVFVGLWMGGIIDWTKNTPKDSQMTFEKQMEKAAEILKPHVLELKNVQLLCIPSYHGDGTKNYNFNYSFYVYEDGKLKSVEYTAK
jgi:hypothetical protein